VSGLLRPALFLDRDGVLNVEVEYLHDPAALVLEPGAAAAVAAVNRLGLPVVVVSNQAGIGRGLYDEAAYHAVQRRLVELLAAEGARIDADYHCPHHPVHGLGPYRAACECRKPRPGMLLQAARDLGLDLRRSVLVGDKLSDLAAGRAAGCVAVLVRTGHGAAEEARARAGAATPWDAVHESLADALPFVRARLGA
jgi:D-glycero-D-manno-heptose 1,7-bisphosphate phosphatase